MSVDELGITIFEYGGSIFVIFSHNLHVLLDRAFSQGQGFS